jgi:hypothetical protein
VADERTTVVLDDGGELRSGELATGHPARELVVPNAVMATEKLAVGLGEVRNLVTSAESEGALRRFGCILQDGRVAGSVTISLRQIENVPISYCLPG